MKSLFLLSVLFIYDTSSAEVKAKFGCKFDSNYNLPVQAESTDIAQIVQPVYGERGIAKFFNEHQFNAFIDDLNRINDIVVQGNQYDTIDNLLTFYNDYKKFGGDSNLNDFLVQYKETDKPVDGASLTIKMVNKMIAMHPQYTTEMLASSLSTCVSGDFGNLSEDQLRVEPHKLPVKNYNDRVMGFLRLNIGSDKMGYVVMDPAHGLIVNMVILDSDIDGKVSLGITRDPLKDIEFYHKYQLRGDYIEVSSSMKNIQSKDSKQTLCYIGKSFCSFENASRKPGLVMPSHSMVVHNDKWIVQGGLFVNLYETSKYHGRVVLWDNDIFGGRTLLKFENTEQLNEQLEVVQNREKVDEVAKAFGKTPNQMDELLTKIGIMFNDHAFMSQMKRLYDLFSQGPTKQDSGYYTDSDE